MPIDTKAHIALDNIDKRVPKELVVDGKQQKVSPKMRLFTSFAQLV